MSGVWSKLVVGALLVALVLAGAWVYARYEVQARFTSLAEHIHGLGPERGLGSIPSEARVAERVRGFAGELDLEVEELDVIVEELEGAELGRVDGVARQLEERLGGMERNVVSPGVEPGAGRGAGQAPGAQQVPVRLSGAVIQVRARVRGAKWLWSRSEVVEARRVLGRQVR